MGEVSFITSNTNKFTEIAEFFKASGLELERIDAKLPEIQAETLEEVVEFSLSSYEGEDVFVEDAGIFIDVLGGFPGVYSRYVFETIGNDGILKLLSGLDDRNARFEAVIGFKPMGGGDIKLFKGEVRGSVSLFPKGESGFGYDPIFVPEGFKRTFGEDETTKSSISHRKRAVEKLIHHLKRNL
jgi:XTP/dITP diphosphohydrolase